MQEQNSTKINFLGPETAGCGGGSSTRRGGGRKLGALPRKFVFLGLQGEEPGISQAFCWDVTDPWGVRKVCAKKGCAQCSALSMEQRKWLHAKVRNEKAAGTDVPLISRRIIQADVFRKWAEYGFGGRGFKHRAQ